MDTRRQLMASFEAERWTGPDWEVVGAVVRERLNEPYYLRLSCAIPTSDFEASSLLGSNACLEIEGRLRVCGVITMVRESAEAEHYLGVQLGIEPALAALRYRTDTRIFQDQTVPEILNAVLGADLGSFGRVLESRLEGDYPSREYTVQFRETDFDFAHRLMEEEGIGYCFEHDGDVEVLVLFDRPGHHLGIAGEAGDTLPFTTRNDGALDNSERVYRFDSVSRARPNRVVARHFDWTHPSVPIEADDELPDGAFPALETYVSEPPLTLHEYDHTYGAHNMAGQLRLEGERARRDVWLADGRSTSLAARAGRCFELEGHPRVDLDGRWTIVEAEHRYASSEAEPSEVERGLVYKNRLVCLPAAVPWRPDRLRPTPRIFGVQTATVVGPPGEEIHCDPHGRIKVHFHWDRLGERNDHDSCWIRVMHAMGGPGWGFTFIPRIGMEVVVTFVEGNPDRPLVTGVVYNGENPTPYALPEHKTRTTIKSNSSPGGNGFNELRFEDLAGQEEIWLHGEKDWNTLIKNDLDRRVGRHESQRVGVDRSRRVGNDERINIGNDRAERIENDQSESVGHDRARDVGNNESIQVGVDRSLSVGNDEAVSIGNESRLTVGSNRLETVGEDLRQQIMSSSLMNVGQNRVRNIAENDTLNVGGSRSVKFGSGVSEKIGGDLFGKIGLNRLMNVTMTDTLNVGVSRIENIGQISREHVGNKKTIEAQEAIELKCGDSVIVLTPEAIYLRASAVHITTEGDVNADSGGNIFLNSGTAEPPPEG